jgi:hypothetical protein
MSQYVLIAGAIILGLGVTATGVATIISAVKGNQASDPTKKGALRAAAGFLGISILFALIILVLLFRLLALKGCGGRGAKIALLIFIILFAISYTIALVILKVYINKLAAANDTAGVRDLNAAFYLPIVAIPLYIVGFILFYVVLGRRLRSARQMCSRFSSQIEEQKKAQRDAKRDQRLQNRMQRQLDSASN